jgi:hypothetical protein
MAASYPAAVKTFTTKENNVDVYDADHINDQQNEITAIETELGTDVAGSATDLKTRLAVSIANSGAIQNGSSFPGSPVAMQAFYRSDTDLLYVRDAGNANWTVIQGSLSNVIFSFAVGGDYTVDNYGVSVNDNLVPASSTITKLSWHVYGETYRDILKSKYKKSAGVNTITVYARGWSNNNSADVQVSIGGQTGGVNWSNATPTFKNFTVDVSSLNNGTIYDLNISLRSTGGGSTMAYMDSIIGFSS